MRYPSFVLTCAVAAAAAWVSAGAEVAEQFVSLKEVAPPYPSRLPPLSEERTARPGEIVYRERAVGLPAARLTEPLTLKNTPAGRVKIDEDVDLRKYLVDGEPYYCALHSLHVRKRKVRRAGFYICLRDGDGNEQTFEEVRIITLVLTILDRKRLPGGKVLTKMKRRHEDTASGTLSPKKFTLTTVDPPTGDHYEAVIKLTSLKNGVANFDSILRDKEGKREQYPKTTEADLSGPFPVTVTIPHPFKGEKIFQAGADTSERDRAVQLEILATEGNTLTYRVVRSFRPWRYWTEAEGRGRNMRIRWRKRP